jgi:hypothetical protein
VALFTNLLGGLGETYPINPGQSLTLPDIERSYWAIKGTTYSTSPVRFNLIGQTRFELRYRNTLPTALQSIYYPGQPSLQVEVPYLAFVQQVSYGRLALSTGNWTVNIDVRTRLCHSATDATINSDCTAITGQQECANVVGQLQVARTSSNPVTNCSGGACMWFDPPARYYGENYRRSWQLGTLTLTFNWNDTEGTGSVQTPPSGGTVEGVQVSLSPEPNDYFRLSATSEVFKGLILMRKRAFLDGSKSLDPLGFPELGENELVFQETPTGVTLQTAVSAWMVASPPESFLLRIPNPDGSETVISDIVDWYASRLFWRSRIPFSFFDWHYGYDRLGGQSGNIFIWERARYAASLLPDYNPNSSTNLLGAQVMEMVFRERPGSPAVVVGRARYEVFFPATGSRHPSGATSEPAGLTIPNWFYYYWRAMGSPAVVFTNRNPFPQLGESVAGFYEGGQPHVYLRNHRANYTTHPIPLFAIRLGQCPENVPANVVTRVDTLNVHGIHAFAATVYHEFGHKWSYETTVQVAPGVYARIYYPPAAFDTGDGDNLADAWEERNGLCPSRKHTTDAYRQYEAFFLPSDPEVVADVLAYGSLLNNAALWVHDWSDQGLRYGNPLERFTAFPWHYNSTGRNTPAHSDLLRGWNP